MYKDDFKLFEGKKDVKLVGNDGFVLHGTVKIVRDDSLVFETSTGLSIIHFNYIRQIVARR